MATLRIFLPDQKATEALAARIAPFLQPGDTLLLSGPIGAGKTTFARALIRAATGNPEEEVPSPSFTLVQTYSTPAGEIWHTDLYRITHPDEALELGLEDAFSSAICLVEWPDRIEGLAPRNALSMTFAAGRAGHTVEIVAAGHWADRLEDALV